MKNNVIITITNAKVRSFYGITEMTKPFSALFARIFDLHQIASKRKTLFSWFLRCKEQCPAIEITTDKITKHLTEVDNEDVGLEQLSGRRYQEVEGIGNWVGKATEDEDGHA